MRTACRTRRPAGRARLDRCVRPRPTWIARAPPTPPAGPAWSCWRSPCCRRRGRPGQPQRDLAAGRSSRSASRCWSGRCWRCCSTASTSGSCTARRALVAVVVAGRGRSPVGTAGPRPQARRPPTGRPGRTRAERRGESIGAVRVFTGSDSRTRRRRAEIGEVPVEPMRRVAMISLHTSPLDQPGTGDAGGMNVYVIELARRMAAQGIEVDIFTRATSSALDPVVAAGDGVQVRHIHAGPFEGLSKGELPGQLCVFAREVLRAEAVAAARPLRRRALPLLALRPGRRARPRPLGRAARALDAHDGQGQERRARRRRHPRAGWPASSARSRWSRPPTC